MNCATGFLASNYPLQAWPVGYSLSLHSCSGQLFRTDSVSPANLPKGTLGKFNGDHPLNRFPEDHQGRGGSSFSDLVAAQAMLESLNQRSP